jgi:hypothetical protein
MTLVLIGSKERGLLGEVKQRELRVIRNLATKALREPLTKYYDSIGSNKSTIKLLFYLCILEAWHYNEENPDQRQFRVFDKELLDEDWLSEEERKSLEQMLVRVDRAEVVNVPEVVVSAFSEFSEEFDGPPRFNYALIVEVEEEDELLIALDYLREWVAEIEDGSDYEALDVACITCLYCLVEVIETKRPVFNSRDWLRKVDRIMDKAAEDYSTGAWSHRVDWILKKKEKERRMSGVVNTDRV